MLSTIRKIFPYQAKRTFHTVSYSNLAFGSTHGISLIKRDFLWQLKNEAQKKTRIIRSFSVWLRSSSSVPDSPAKCLHCRFRNSAPRWGRSIRLLPPCTRSRAHVVPRAFVLIRRGQRPHSVYGADALGLKKSWRWWERSDDSESGVPFYFSSYLTLRNSNECLRSMTSLSGSRRR